MFHLLLTDSGLRQSELRWPCGDKGEDVCFDLAPPNVDVSGGTAAAKTGCVIVPHNSEGLELLRFRRRLSYTRAPQLAITPRCFTSAGLPASSEVSTGTKPSHAEQIPSYGRFSGFVCCPLLARCSKGSGRLPRKCGWVKADSFQHAAYMSSS